MKRFYFLIFLSYISFSACFARATSPARVTVKPNIHSFTQGRADLRRDTIIYRQEKLIVSLNIKMSENWSANVGFDYNFSKNIPYLKPAFLTFRKDRWTVDAGIFATSELDKAMSSFWGNRFIDRVAVDKWMRVSSADLGARVTYRWNDFITTDVSLSSGNGYQQLREKYHPKPTFRAIITPIRPLQLGGLIAVRKENDIVETSFSGFAHFQPSDKWKATGEYHRQADSRFVEGQRLDIASVYGTYYLTTWMSMMGRYDFIKSNRMNASDENWNVQEDGQAIICGLIFRCLPTVRISVNYWNKRPSIKRIDKEDWVYFCLEFKY